MSGTGGGKRPSGGDSPPGPPEKKSKKEEKTTTTLIEPIRIGGVSSTEEMDLKVIQFKNKKLCERLEQRQAMEDELREKIEKLEKRQATDDTTLLIVNRYWSQLEEKVSVMRQRIQPAAPPPPASSAPPPASSAPPPAPMEDGGAPPPPAPTVPPLPDGDAQEEQQKEPPPPPDGGTGVPPRPTEPPHPAAVEGAARLPPPPLSEPAKVLLATLDHSGEEELALQLQDRMQFSKEAVACLVCVFDRLHSHINSLCRHVQEAASRDQPHSDVLGMNRALLEENGRRQDLASFLQGRHHKMSLEHNELVDKVMGSETKVSEMETTVEDLQWDIEKLRKREQKLNKLLAEGLDQLNSGYNSTGSSGGLPGGQITLNIQKVPTS